MGPRDEQMISRLSSTVSIVAIDGVAQVRVTAPDVNALVKLDAAIGMGIITEDDLAAAFG